MTINGYDFTLTEEISRWAFEIAIRQYPSWLKVFSNPTGGPWKVIKAPSSTGVYGEAYRFKLKEKRPDLILVNDSLRIVLVIEAKDNIEKLLEVDQIQKTIDTAIFVSEELSKLNNNPYWMNRTKYTYQLGLLWGTSYSVNSSRVGALMKAYIDSLSISKAKYSDCIVGIEAQKNKDLSIECHMYIESYACPKLIPTDPVLVEAAFPGLVSRL